MISSEQLALDTKYYWTYEKGAEVDFLLYNDDGIIPIELKSENSVKSTSLNLYIKENKTNIPEQLENKN